MTWVCLALIPPVLFALCNYIDKLVLSTIFPNDGPGSLILSTSIVSATMALIALCIAPEALSIIPSKAVLIALNGALYPLAMIPYIIALSRANTSRVAPLFHLRHGIVLLLAFLVLHELPSILQMVGIALACLGVFLVSVDRSKNTPLTSSRVLLLMVLASTLLAVYTVMFKYFQLDNGFWPTKFWEYIGETVVALGFALSLQNRAALSRAWRTHRMRMVFPLGLSECLNVIGLLIFTFALTLGPAALVSTFIVIHPVVVLILGLVLGRCTTLYHSEKLSKQEIATRVAGTLTIVIGCIFMGTV